MARTATRAIIRPYSTRPCACSRDDDTRDSMHRCRRLRRSVRTSRCPHQSATFEMTAHAAESTHWAGVQRTTQHPLVVVFQQQRRLPEEGLLPLLQLSKAGPHASDLPVLTPRSNSWFHVRVLVSRGRASARTRRRPSARRGPSTAHPVPLPWLRPTCRIAPAFGCACSRSPRPPSAGGPSTSCRSPSVCSLGRETAAVQHTPSSRFGSGDTQSGGPRAP
jgi:hypothetical protein